jgi:hypothetical protein
MKRETILKVFESMTEERLQKSYEIIELLSKECLFKSELIEYFAKEDANKIDSAIPLDYSNKIKELNPGFNPFIHCYDYREKAYGQMLNIYEAFVQKAISNLKED